MHDLWAKIAAAADLPRRAVRVEAWGVDLWVRTLSGLERDELERRLAAMASGGELPVAVFKRWWIAYATVDADGARVFADDQVEPLAAKSGAALDLLYRHAAELNGIGQDLEKN